MYHIKIITEHPGFWYPTENVFLVTALYLPHYLTGRYALGSDLLSGIWPSVEEVILSGRINNYEKKRKKSH